MRRSSVPAGFEDLLAGFRGCFTRPGFRHFSGLVVGWILGWGRHTISRVIQAAGDLLNRRHFSSVYRFLAAGRWTVDALSAVVFRGLLALLPAEVTVIVDDTLCQRTGPHLFGGGMFHDALRSTYGRGSSRGRQVRFAFGHSWVVLAVWLPLPWNPTRGKAVPVLFRLYRSKRLCPEDRYHKRTELAAELLRHLVAWLPEGRSLCVLGDAEYACRTLVRTLPDRVEFLGPLTLDAALYGLVPPYAGRGRPRQHGARQPSPRSMAASPRGWSTLHLTLYGRPVTLQYKTRTGLWYTVAGQRPVRVVVVRDPSGRLQTRAYFATHPERCVLEILALYARRWELEVTFREAKQSLGLQHPQNGWWRRRSGTRRPPKRPGPQPRGTRGQYAVQRTVPLTLVIYTLVVQWYCAHGRPRQDVARVRRSAPWYRHKLHPSFDDMLGALRRETWRARFLATPLWQRFREKSGHRLYPWGLAA